MMEKLIYLEAAIEAVQKSVMLNDYEKGFIQALLQKVPAVDAAPVVHGRWENPYINRYGHPCHCCSVCGFKASYQDKNYCPNCGAKMDLKEGGNDG